MNETISALNKIFARTLRALSDAGESHRACELAAEAWSLLRHDHEKEAERINGVMHYMTGVQKTKRS